VDVRRASLPSVPPRVGRGSAAAAGGAALRAALYAARVTVTVHDLAVSDVAQALAVQPGTTEKHLTEELARPFARSRVAKDATGVVVGFLLTWLVADEVHVLDVAVRADLRRRGIGRVLMLDAIAHARADGRKQLLLEVRRSNAPAIALYRALGFYAVNVRKRYYPDDEDAIEMILALDPAGGIVHHPDEIDVAT
jgi:ribosomal-protein-alanine N-acetyltransferase